MDGTIGEPDVNNAPCKVRSDACTQASCEQGTTLAAFVVSV